MMYYDMNEREKDRFDMGKDKVTVNKVFVLLHECSWLPQKKCRLCLQARHTGLLSRNSWEMEKLIVGKNELLLKIQFTNQIRYIL